MLALVTGVLTWGDLVAEKAAWTTPVWFSVLVMMAGRLQEIGVIGWCGDSITNTTSGVARQAACVILTLGFTAPCTGGGLTHHASGPPRPLVTADLPEERLGSRASGRTGSDRDPSL